MYKVLFFSFIFLAILQYYQIDKNGADRHLQGNSSNKSKMPKVLIYITTHMSQQHKEHFKHCWPLALKNSYLLNSSDIKVFMSPDPVQVGESIQLLKETFKGQNFTYHIQTNQDKQNGAIAAIYQAAQNDWFDGYDWVFRMNPDVIIQDDTWMLDTIKNDVDASLLYVECLPQDKPLLRNTNKIHTDFFGLKPGALPKGQLLMAGNRAEALFSQQVAPIIAKGQHRHVPDTFPILPIYCRANGNPQGPVFHFQDDIGWVADIVNGICPATFNNLDENYNWI